jgi:hypothetical protein
MILDRRSSPRAKAVENRIWTGWWAGTDEFVTQASVIENISLGGARVCTASPPDIGENVWIRLARPDQFQTVQGKVLEVLELEQGTYWVRLEFDEQCPESFFMCVLYGGPARPELTFSAW